MLLAIDTSTDMASLALVEGNRMLAELTWHCEQSHTVALLPQLMGLLSQIGLNLQSTQSIVVARGPGSFNGLRVGISTAKGLAFSLEVPITGISTLEVEAYRHADTGLPVCAVSNVGRGEIAAAVFQRKRGHWIKLTAEHITTIEVLCSQIATKTIFCGEFVPSIAPHLRGELKQKAVIPSLAANLRRAGFLAELGQQKLEAGDDDDPATLQPLYLRQPPITEPRHR